MQNMQSEGRLAYAQEKVMDGYRKRGAVKNSNDERMLHMFFSPSRVPKGMTNAEVGECLANYALRSAGNKVSLLPTRLRPVKRMTRGQFKLGMAEFLGTKNVLPRA